MERARKILHVDLDAFFCAVEEQLDPSLKGKPFAVGGDPNQRGVVSSCSYAARRLGVHSAMPMSQAVRVCPGLLIVHGGHHLYREKSEEVMAILRNWTPLMEPVSIDEAFLDVSDIPKDGRMIALEIQKEINSRIVLPCSFGVASNKLVAKIANTIGKKKSKSGSYPNAVTQVLPGSEAAFLAPLPIGELWGVGDRTEKLLRDLGICRIGQLASYPSGHLSKIFGRHAGSMRDRALGLDDRPVDPDPQEAKSVSQECTFAQDVDDESLLRKTILHQSDQIGFRLRKYGLCGNTVRLKLRWSNFVTLSRQIKLDQRICQNDWINLHAQNLFTDIWQKESRPIRLIGVGVSGLSPEPVQLSLFQQPSDKIDRLLQAVDEIRIRYGEKGLKRGIELEEESF